jgi:prepilin-type processing-associated H-X9-DG protein
MMAVETSWQLGPWTAGGYPTSRGLDPSWQPYLGSGKQFSGYHPGKTNILLADGSARSISESISPQVFEALATIAGGDKIGDLGTN